jgi:N-acetylneuraminic acid mutarotase
MRNTCVIYTSTLLLFCQLIIAQGIWIQKSNYPGNVKQSATGFSIGNYGYLGLGYEAFGYATDFEKYDPLSDSWTPIANFPGGARWSTVGFSIGNFGYVSTGFRSSPNTYYSDLWRYDPVGNSWLQMATFPGGGRWNAVGFSIGGKGYVGLGYNGVGTFFSDIWEYDPGTNTWTAKASFPGAKAFATSFTIGNKAYIVGGAPFATGCTNDVWEFDPIANTWTVKASYPGSPCDRMVSFAFGGFGYAGTGKATGNGAVTTDFFKYDPSANTWTPITFFTGSARWLAVGFNIGNKGYLGTGNINCPSPGCDLDDLWEYSVSNVGIAETHTSGLMSVCPNPVRNILNISFDSNTQKIAIEISNNMGQIILKQDFSDQIDVSSLAQGSYFLKVIDQGKVYYSKFLKE